MNKIPEETLKQWREEFEKYYLYDHNGDEKFYREPDHEEIYLEDVVNISWLSFLEAKTSSYEREQEQELLKELEKNSEVKTFVELSTTYKLSGKQHALCFEFWNAACRNKNIEIQKLQDNIKELESKLTEHTDRREECSKLAYKNEKLQERVKELEKDLSSEKKILFHTLEIEKIHISEIAKRDELIEQAKGWTHSHIPQELKWLKEVEELKEKK